MLYVNVPDAKVMPVSKMIRCSGAEVMQGDGQKKDDVVIR